MKTLKTCRALVLASALGVVAFAQAATTPIQFNPNGTGAPGSAVATFDWAVNSSLALNGNPARQLAVGSKVVVLSQASLANLFNSVGFPILVPVDTQFTFVTGFGEKVARCNNVSCTDVAFVFDDAELSQNFFELWVHTPQVSNNLEGTGFNISKRIMYGKVTDASGNFVAGTCPTVGGVVKNDLDQFGANDWPNQKTICGGGSTQIAVQVLSVDSDYFPDFSPANVANLKARFNTSTVVPFRQTDPSRRFIGNSLGFTFDPGDVEPVIVSTTLLGAVNGQPDGTDHAFEFQSDANQAFEEGVTVPGACRVTYGGNDRNGNIAPNSFGQACMKVKGGTENCYTFGGQVGAPTANPALDGPFGEHTHHQVSGPAGDFVFRAGTHSAPKATRITATACYDPGACRQAEANAGFKQIDFEGTGSFRTLSDTAKAYLKANGAENPQPDNASDQIYYFRVDMDDTGEPGNKASPKRFDIVAANKFFAADQNLPLNDPEGDPLVETYGACNTMADVYQFFICKDANRCEAKDAIYSVRAFLTGGNIQLHKVIK